MSDITAKEVDELMKKLGINPETIKKAFAKNFAEAMSYLNNPNLGTETNRIQAQVLYFGFKVGYVKGLETERFTLRVFPR